MGAPRGDGQEAEARDPRLDGLRGLAIALVIFYHTTQFGLARGVVANALSVIPSVGWSGVDLFFVLSGFLITGILLRAKASPSYYRAFYARRVLRIFPLYYAVLVVFLLIVPRIPLFAIANDFWYPGVARQGIWYWLYLSNLHAALAGAWQHQILDITWSLAIEEHFYLIWPWVVRRCDERRLLAICAVTALGALAMRAALAAAGAPSIAGYTLTPCRLDTLATGAAIALAVARPGGFAALARPARAVLPAALALFAACYAWVRLRAPAVPPARGLEAATVRALSFTTEPLILTVGFTLLCVVYGALLVWVLTAPAGSLRARAFEAAWLRSFGRYSYGMYLLHLPAAMLLTEFLPPGRYPRQYLLVQPVFWALAFASSYGLARLSWLVVEQPMLRLKRFFPYRL
jgi:peptidoglycan/LPS O-acetylase OafA/YrhL